MEKIIQQAPKEEAVVYNLGRLIEDSRNSKCYARLENFSKDGVTISLSPDVDLLEDGEELVTYEVKGYRKNGLKLGQVLKGIGQAMSNLIWVREEDGEKQYFGFADKSFVAVPENDEPWMKMVSKFLEENVVGLIEVGNEGFNIISQAKGNPYLDEEKQKWFKSIDIKERKHYKRKISLRYTL